MDQSQHEDFRVGGFVSVWLGNFASEDELDGYLIEQFGNDFGFEVYETDGPEGAVSEEGALPVPQLLDGFSHWHSFVEAATEEAQSRGLSQATTALLFYNLKYDAQLVSPDASGALTFIETFPYEVSENQDEA